MYSDVACDQLFRKFNAASFINRTAFKNHWVESYRYQN
jgi:hypothetical protein